jgi:hypothetical protein
MVETITPVVHGGRGRWLGALVLHASGAALTAALFGAALGWTGGLLGAPWGRAGLLVLTAVAATYAVGELTRRRVPVPQLRRQVPDWWRTFFGRPIASVLYGAGLGVGFFTFLAHGTLVVVAFAALASGRPWLGALLMMPFGLARGLSAAVAWGSNSPERSRAVVDRLVLGSEARRRVLNGAALVVVAGLAAIASVRVDKGGWATFGAAVLAAVFTWSAATKVLGIPSWRRTLRAHRLPPSVERVAVWSVPVLEAFVPLLVLAGRPRSASWLALVLLVVFTAELVRADRAAGAPVACGCFGGHDAIDPRRALARNATLGALVVAVGLSTRDAYIAWPRPPAPADVVPLALASVSLFAAVLTSWRVSVWLSRGRRG